MSAGQEKPGVKIFMHEIGGSESRLGFEEKAAWLERPPIISMEERL